MLQNQTGRNVGAMLRPISQGLLKAELSPPPLGSGLRGADGHWSLVTDGPQEQPAQSLQSKLEKARGLRSPCSKCLAGKWMRPNSSLLSQKGNDF